MKKTFLILQYSILKSSTRAGHTGPAKEGEELEMVEYRIAGAIGQGFDEISPGLMVVEHVFASWKFKTWRSGDRDLLYIFVVRNDIYFHRNGIKYTLKYLYWWWTVLSQLLPHRLLSVIMLWKNIHKWTSIGAWTLHVHIYLRKWKFAKQTQCLCLPCISTTQLLHSQNTIKQTTILGI